MNAESPANMDFSSLVNQIRELNLQSQTAAAKSVNLMLTLRNWQIGSYISEYELHGSDRAEYGDGIIISLAKELQKF